MKVTIATWMGNQCYVIVNGLLLENLVLNFGKATSYIVKYMKVNYPGKDYLISRRDFLSEKDLRFAYSGLSM